MAIRIPSIAPVDAQYQPHVPERLSDEVQELNRFRDSLWARTAASLVPTFGAMRAGGPGAAMAVARSFHDRDSTGLTPKEALAAKQKLLELMADLSKTKLEKLPGVLDSLKMQDDALKVITDAITSAFTGSASANATVAASKNALIGKTNEDYMRLFTETLGGVAGVNAETIRRSVDGLIEHVRDTIGNEYAYHTDQVARAIREWVITNDQLDPRLAPAVISAGVSAVEALVQSEMPGQSFDLLSALAQDARNNAQANPDYIQTIATAQETFQKASARALVAGKEIAFEALEKGLRGVANADKIIPLLKRAFEEFDLDPANPRKTLESLEGVFAIVFPGMKNDPQMYADMLDEISDQTIQPGTTLWEKRQGLFESEDFQKFKRDNGYQTNAEALEGLRVLMRKQAFQARQKDRAKTNALRAADVQATETSPGAAATDPTKLDPKVTPAAGGEAGEPRYFIYNEKLWVNDGSGLHEADDAERAVFDESARLYPEETRASLGTPAEFFKLEEEQEKRKSEMAVREASLHEEYAQKNTPPAISPTIGQVGSLIGHSLFHPRATVEEIRARLQRRPKDRRLGVPVSPDGTPLPPLESGGAFGSDMGIPGQRR